MKKAMTKVLKKIRALHKKNKPLFWVLAVFSMLVIYYTIWASPRYVSQTQFLVKEAGGQEMAMDGLLALGGTSPSMRDALVLQKYIESPSMAKALDDKLQLKAHFQKQRWDIFSRLASDATREDYAEYYLQRVSVFHDELSDSLLVSVQTYDAEYSLKVAEEILHLSEKFINEIGAQMAREQVAYALQDVEEKHADLKVKQSAVVSFQDEYGLYNPEQQGGALLGVINELESQIIREEAQLKSLLAFMNSEASEVKARKNTISALRDQLQQEKQRLTSEEVTSLNKINVRFHQLQLTAALAEDLYKGALAGLEQVRADAVRKLKHLLVIETPSLAEEAQFPRRLYSIATWGVLLAAAYLICFLIVSIVREHRD